MKQSNQYLDTIVKLLKEGQKRTGAKLLWGTAQLFVHPRYAHGASTSCNAEMKTLKPLSLNHLAPLDAKWVQGGKAKTIAAL